MAIKQAIRDIIINDATLSGLVGTRVSPRISKTGDTLPRVCYLRTNTDVEYYMGGTSTLRFDSYNIIITGDSSDECDTISERVKIVLESALNETQDSTYIHRLYMESSNEGHYYPDGREKPIYEVIQNWKVSYQDG